MITIERYKYPIVDLYGPTDYMGSILNEVEFAKVRLQIATLQLEGYYIIFNEEKITINKYGVLSSWPVGLYDENENVISKLLKIGIESNKKYKI